MAREGKGTKVKSFTAYVPQPDLERQKVAVSVYFQAKESNFYGYLPKHVADAVNGHPGAPSRLYHDAIRSPLADEIEPQFNQALKLYERIQQNAVRKKVIKVYVRANGAHRRMPEGFAFHEISFSGPGPALSFNHEVMWLIGEGLYRSNRGDNGLDYLTYMSAMPDESKRRPHAPRETFVIDWTEEREAFFKNINDGLITLIVRLAELLGGDTAHNVDRLIAGGGGLMLPAPQREDA